MTQNPYKYEGSLDPTIDKDICIPRKERVNQIISGIMAGDYWAVLGPRHIGKTTFIRQLEHQFSNAHYLYFSFKKPPASEKKLYRWLIDKFMDEIPADKPKKFTDRWQDEGPDFRFFEFLTKFSPKDDIKKIILLFDDIDHIPSLGNFLIVWRNIYIERYYEKALNRYAVLLTGSVNLIAKTSGGPTSPFNIAEILEIEDFSNEESTMLIEKSMTQFNINIEAEAKDYLLSLVSGHPQLLQHACHILVEKAYAANKSITKKDVEEVKKVLFKKNQNLKMLKHELKSNDKLRKLLQDILNNKKTIYHPHKELSLLGVGPIVERDSYCAIRNKLYEEVIKRN